MQAFASPCIRAPIADHSQKNRAFLTPQSVWSLWRIACACALVACLGSSANPDDRPNVILVMADDMGWGQTGYYEHPVLKTPHLDAMAASGLRFDRFYAGAPVCSPTRATVLTGRTNDRSGVLSHGYGLRRQEKTLAQAMRAAGYATAHFGKWHLNALRGPGVPILASDNHHPGHFGFKTWISTTNFFDQNPILSRQGTFQEFRGDSSEVIVDLAIDFIDEHRRQSASPFFCVLWYGSPHNPFTASAKDTAPFAELDATSQQHYGELVAMDRSIGTLRAALRQQQLEANTLLWFCSDNGGLPKIAPDTTGGLRGFKGQVYEGGLRVPAILEWPAAIPEPRTTSFVAGTVDIFPTLADLLDLSADAMLAPIDGISLRDVIKGDAKERPRPLAFRHRGRAALVDQRFKLVTQDIAKESFELYDLQHDPEETANLASTQPGRAKRMAKQLRAWSRSVDASQHGADYPEGRVDPHEPQPRFWMALPEFQAHFPDWKKRPEYAGRIRGYLRKSQ